MALKYDSYSTIYPAGITLNSRTPLDIRTVVEDVTDLTTTLADKYVYQGMLVSVTNNKSVYIFAPDSSADYDATNVSSWKKVGGQSLQIEAMTVKKYNACYYDRDLKETIALYNIDSTWYRADDDQEYTGTEEIQIGDCYADAEGGKKGIYINDPTVQEKHEGEYIKVTDLDNGSETYSKINFDDLYDKITEVSTNVYDVSARLASLGNIFIFKGDASINPYATPENASYLLKDGVPIYSNTSLFTGHVYITENNKEWVFVDEDNDGDPTNGHWVEFGYPLDGIISKINVNTDKYINASVSDIQNRTVTIDVSLYITNIDDASTPNSGLVTAYDVSQHLKNIKSGVSSVTVSDDISAYIHTEPSIGDVVINASIKGSTNSSFENTALVTDGWVNERFAWVCIN